MTVTVDGITYTLSGSTAIVTGTSAGPATTTTVTIPSTITISGTTYNVTSIGANAFSDYTNLTSVIIPSSVTSIGNSAFANSTLLESITIPNSVTSIGNSTFTNCPKLATVKFMGDIPHIGSDNFWANTNDTAYYNTGAKNTVALYLSPPTPYYFTNVREITSAQPAPVISVTHSDQSTTINFTQGTTAGLNPVTKFEYSIDSGVNWVSAGTTTTSPITVTGLTNGTSYNFALRNFNGLYSGVSNIVPAVPGVPDAPTITGVTVSTSQAVINFTAGADNGSSISSYQYSTDGGSNWVSVEGTGESTSITVTGLTNGTTYDFRLRAVNANGAGPYDTSGLALVSNIIYTLSGSIATVIGANTDATTLTIPSTITISGTTYNVTSIGANAFSDYTNLTSVIIPSSVTSIGTWVFQNCTSLSSIVVDSTNTVFSSLNNVLFNKEQTILIVYPIGLSSTSYTIPSSVTIIAGAAFDSCSNLTSIIITSSVITIGDGAFSYSDKLTSVTIPNGLLTIGASAFFGCNLTSIFIPSSVTTIGDSDNYTFFGCPLTSIVVDPANTVYSSLDNVLFNKDKTTLIQYASGLSSSTYTVPSSVITIADNAFTGCTNLAGVAFMGDIPTIGTNNFTENTSDTAYYYTGAQNISRLSPTPPIFANVLAITSAQPAPVITSVSISNQSGATINFTQGTTSDLNPVSIIDYSIDGGLNWVSAETITSPITVTGFTIGTSYNFILRNFNGLYSTLSNNNFSIFLTSIDGITYTLSESNATVTGTTSGATTTTTVTIPSTIDYLGNTYNVTSISDYAFQNYTNLSSVTIPNGLLTIGGNAFYGCSSLTSVSLPTIVTGIDNYVFGGCYNIQTINNAPITVSWHSISISQQNNSTSFFNGFFSTFDIANTTIINTFYNSSQVNTNIIAHTDDDYSADFVLLNGNALSFGGTTITSIPALDSQYGSQEWSLNLQGSLAYKNSVNDWIDLADSFIFTILPSSVPAAPTINSVTVSTSQAIINFTAGADNGSPITGYQYSTDGGSNWTPTILTTSTSIITMTSATTGSITVTDLTNGTSYNFQIKAVNSVGASVPSDSFTASTPDVPSAPTIDSVTVSSGQAIINFTAGADNGSPITGYQYSTDGGSNWTPTILTTSTSIINMTSTTSGSITVTDLTNGTSYNFSIKAVNAVGAGSIWTSSGSTLVTDIAYTLSGSNATIFGTRAGPATTTTATIPSTIAYLGSTYNVTSIHTQAFSNYNILTSVTIGSNVTSIGDYAFYNCPKLTIVTIPNSVTIIGIGAFRECSSLTSVTLPTNNNLFTNISDYAFYKCISLADVTIPNTVTSIGNGAFRECSSLTSVTLPTNNNLFTNISDYAFYKCDSLARVTLPNSVTSIGNSAFRECSSLTSVTLPTNNNLFTNISDYAFYKCISLADVTLPNSVTIIGIGAFRECSSLANISIPSSVIRIDTQAFAYTAKLTEIFVDINNNYFSSLNGVLFDKLQTTLIKYPTWNSATSYTVPSTVTTISNRAFGVLNYSDNKLISVTLNNGLVTIDDYTFRNCAFTSIIIPNSVTTIGNYVFYICSSLSSVTFMGDIPLIGKDNFTENTNDTAYYYSGAQNISRLSPTPPIFTNVVKIEPPPGEVPSAPTIDSVTVSSGQAIINFTTGADNGSPITGYQYSTDGGSNWTPTILTTSTSIINMTSTTSGSITVTDLTNETSYNFSIKAVNAVGVSVPSDSFTASTPSVPSAPTINSVTVSTSQAIINFTAGADNGSPITGYQYSTDGGSNWTPTILTTSTSIITMTSATTGSITVTDLTNGTSYNFQIKAVNSIGDGAPSDSFTASTPDVPSAPTIDSVTVSSGQAEISFTPGADNDSPITGYEFRVNRGDWTSAWFAREGTLSPITVGGLENEYYYTFNVRAVNGVGPGAFASTVSTLIRNVISVTTPTINNVTIDLYYVNIHFTGSGNKITYQSETTIGSSNVVGEQNTTQTTSPLKISVNSFADGYTFRVKIREYNDTQTSNYSSSYTFRYTSAEIAPGPPTIDSVTIFNNIATLNFTPGQNLGTPIQNYEYSTDGGNLYYPFSEILSPIQISNLKYGDYYNFKIIAVNTKRGTPSSTYGPVLIPFPPGYCPAPTITSVTVDSLYVNVNFTGSGNKISYRVDTLISNSEGGMMPVKLRPGMETIISGPIIDTTQTTSPLQIPISAFTIGTPLYLNIREYNTTFTSDFSTKYRFTYDIPPGPPTINNVIFNEGYDSIYFTEGTNSGSPISYYEYNINGSSVWNKAFMESGVNYIDVPNFKKGLYFTVKIRAFNNIAGAASNPYGPVLAELPPGDILTPTITNVTVRYDVVTVYFTASGNTNNLISCNVWYISNRQGVNYYYNLFYTNSAPVTSPLTFNIPINENISYGQIINVDMQEYNPIDGKYSDSAYTYNFTYGAAPVAIVPGAPTITDVTISSGKATIDFTPGPSNGSPIRNYEYRIDGVSNGEWYPAFTQTNTGEIFTTSSPIITQNLGLSNRISYTFILRAISGPGGSGDSSAPFITSSRLTLSQLKAENANKETYIENGYGLLEMINSHEFPAKYLTYAGFNLTELIPYFTPDELIKTGKFGGKELKQAGLIKNGIQFNKIFHYNKHTNAIEVVDFYFLKGENKQTNNQFTFSNGKITTAQEKSIPI